MKYNNFEDLPVWQDAVELAAMTFETTEDKAFRFRGDIANQLQRAVLSISNNIAEGFERGTTQELIMFLYYAKGSAGEVRSICCVIERLEAFGHLKSQISDIKSRVRDISRQLSGWAQSLQETDIKGARHLTTRSKEEYESGKKAAAFMEQMKKDQEERIRRLKTERSGQQEKLE